VHVSFGTSSFFCQAEDGIRGRNVEFRRVLFRSFDLEKIAEEVGYPLYMKPFDGGGWRGVSRVDDVEGLHRSYDESGNMLMHLQRSEERRVGTACGVARGPIH